MIRGLGIRPVALDVNPRTGYVYIVNYESDSVSILSGTQLVKNVPVGEDPRATRVKPATGYVYVADLCNILHVFSRTQFIDSSFGGNVPAIQAHGATGYVYAELGGDGLGSHRITANRRYRPGKTSVFGDVRRIQTR